MWSVGLCVLALLTIWITHRVNKWRNPKCNGVLPPGSMGFPLIGETLQLCIPSYSLDLHPFVKRRIQSYGPVFRTNLVGRPVVVSADPDVNHFLLLQEGKSVELWYLDTFSKIFAHEGESRITAAGRVHRYMRGISLNHFGFDRLKAKLLPQIEEMVTKTLRTWSSHASIEVKHAASTMIFNFTAKQMFSYDYENSSGNISDEFTKFPEGLMSFPLNIPGTTYHKCLKSQKKVLKWMKDMVKERRASPAETRHGDLLDQVIDEMKTEKFLDEDFIVKMIFAVLFAALESTSGVLALAFKLLADHPSVLQELTAEHEEILKNKKDMDATLTWEEYKSMTFTLQVVNEVLRLGSFAPGMLRKALKDIKVNGYTIPAGWTIMVLSSALQLSPDVFEDPLAFNPWRWKGLDSNVTSKNFMPFGGGMRQCAGADYSRVFMATFFHVLVTKYRWEKIKGGDVVRNPILGFGNGIHIKVINETFRLANVGPGLLRKVLTDVRVNGYTIPAGWTIMLASSALQLNHNTFEDPLAFNPWRWKDLDSNVISKNFMPFGKGKGQCPGADYSKVFMATFFHVLVTKYRWKKIRGGNIVRNPILGFGDGIHIKLSRKA